jgi:hypothetical protein
MNNNSIEEPLAIPQTIAIKFDDNKVKLPYTDSVEKNFQNAGLTSLIDIFHAYPGITMNRMFTTLSQSQLETMMSQARQNNETYSENLLSWYKIFLPNDVEAEKVVNELKELDIIESVYLETIPVSAAPVNFDDKNVKAKNQRYQMHAPDGIDARFAWDQAGGDGEGVQFIDIEQGWTLNHEDLISKGITLISGKNDRNWHHGTNVLGVVVGVDNEIGGVGIAPNVSSARVVSVNIDDPLFGPTLNIPDAIITAGFALNPGDVLLIESALPVSLPIKPDTPNLPVELATGAFEAIKTVTSGENRVVVVEAAGNGGLDLDGALDSDGIPNVLNRSEKLSFKDSGAIMVGAATSTTPHQPIPNFVDDRRKPSNIGNRIDCYAWGENVTTATSDKDTGTITNQYTDFFCCTSAASSIIAGAALCVQGIAKKNLSQTITPLQMRFILSNVINTLSAGFSLDKIGVMPDLRNIISTFLSAGTSFDLFDFPLPTSQLKSKIEGGDGPLKKDDTRTDLVKRLQSILKIEGYAHLLGSTGPNQDGVDGTFKTSTEDAVLSFQSKNFDEVGNPLERDGKVGFHTALALNTKIF